MNSSDIAQWNENQTSVVRIKYKYLDTYCVYWRIRETAGRFLADYGFFTWRMKFCTPREGNPGNVLLIRRNPPKYFYQCELENCESTQDCAGTEKTSEKSCSMSTEQYCVYTTEVDFAEARFVKASIFHRSLWQKNMCSRIRNDNSSPPPLATYSTVYTIPRLGGIRPNFIMR